MWDCRASTLDAWPYAATTETSLAERRIRPSHPKVRVRFHEQNGHLTVFALAEDGGAVHLFDAPSISDRELSRLDEAKRRAERRILEANIEAEAKWNAHFAERNKVTWTADEEEELARTSAEAAKLGAYDVRPFTGHHGQAELDHHVFVKHDVPRQRQA